jgi:ribosomal protein S27E
MNKKEEAIIVETIKEAMNLALTESEYLIKKELSNHVSTFHQNYGKFNCPECKHTTIAIMAHQFIRQCIVCGKTFKWESGWTEVKEDKKDAKKN